MSIRCEYGTHRYTVGDTVEIIGQKNLSENDPETGCYFNKDMAVYIGKECTIEEEEFDGDRGYWFYRLIGVSGWIWVDAWLKPVDVMPDISFEDSDLSSLL